MGRDGWQGPGVKGVAALTRDHIFKNKQRCFTAQNAGGLRLKASRWSTRWSCATATAASYISYGATGTINSPPTRVLIGLSLAHKEAAAGRAAHDADAAVSSFSKGSPPRPGLSRPPTPPPAAAAHCKPHSRPIPRRRVGPRLHVKQPHPFFPLCVPPTSPPRVALRRRRPLRRRACRRRHPPTHPPSQGGARGPGVAAASVHIACGRGGGGGTREPRRPASTTRGTPVAVAGQTAARGGADGRPSRPALRARAQHRRRCHCLPRRNPIVQRRRRGRGFAVASWPRLGPLMGRDEAACAGAVTLKHTPPASLTSSPGRRQHHLPPQPHPLPLIVPPCGTSLRTALPAPPTCPR